MKYLVLLGMAMGMYATCVSQVVNGVWTIKSETSITASSALSVPSGTPYAIPTTKDGATIHFVIFKAEEEITLKEGFTATSEDGDHWFQAYLVPPLSYAELKEEVDGSFCATIDHRLYVRYVEKYKPGQVDYKIYNSKHAQVLSGKLTISSVGSNFLPLDLPGLTARNEAESFYLLEIKNSKGDRHVVRFKYIL